MNIYIYWYIYINNINIIISYNLEIGYIPNGHSWQSLGDMNKTMRRDSVTMRICVWNFVSDFRTAVQHTAKKAQQIEILNKNYELRPEFQGEFHFSTPKLFRLWAIHPQIFYPEVVQTLGYSSPKHNPVQQKWSLPLIFRAPKLWKDSVFTANA